MAEFKVKGQWRTEGYGHVYTAKAVTPTGRILAVVNIEVPLDVTMDITSRFGREWVSDVESSAHAQVEQVAAGWEAPVKESLQ